MDLAQVVSRMQRELDAYRTALMLLGSYVARTDTAQYEAMMKSRLQQSIENAHDEESRAHFRETAKLLNIKL